MRVWEVVLKEEEQRWKKGSKEAWKGRGKKLCKRGGRGKGLREAEEAEGRMQRRKEFETLS